MSRRTFIAGNWKMNTNPVEGAALVRALIPLVKDAAAQVAVCPPYTGLAAAAEALEGTNIELGAQNLHAVEKDGKIVDAGAYTGEVGPAMLKAARVRWVILGHSERRQYFGETDAGVNLKIRAAFAGGLLPIVCVGETLEEREAGRTADVVATQVKGCFANIPVDQANQCVIAYEPVWAIGTGKTASPAQAQEVHAHIRALLTELYDKATADVIRIQYGGSMKPDNAAELLAQPDIDGGLIGGAALKAPDFAGIVNAGK